MRSVAGAAGALTAAAGAQGLYLLQQDRKSTRLSSGQTCALPILETFYGRLVGERSDAAYRANPTITLATVYDWWAFRVPYYEKRGIPTQWPRHMMRLNESAARAGTIWDADISRQQEVMRPPPGGR